MMKKIVSILCVLALLLGVAAVTAVSAGAEDVKKGSTAVDVKSGDEVSYSLYLENVEQPIIGSDFSVYYDSSVFEVVSVADFNNKTNEDDWEATINPDLDGQVRGVWSILKGVDFSSKRNFLTVNLKAKADANNSHITYRIRYLYDDNVFNSAEYPQIDDYLFTCTLTLNGEEVLQDAAPEVNVDEPEENGKFISSYDGNSEHADASIPGVVDKKKSNNSGSGNNSSNDGQADNNGGGSNNGSGSGSNGGSAGSVSGGNNSGGSANGGSKSVGSSEANAPASTSAGGMLVTSTDANGNVISENNGSGTVTTTGNNQGGTSPVLWIIIALVVLAGGGAAAYFYMKKKPADAENAAAAAEKAEGTPAEVPAEEKTEEAPAEEKAEEAPAEEKAEEAPAEEKAEEAPAEEKAEETPAETEE